MTTFLKKTLASAYFPTQKYAVSWAMKSLTAEFGMGSGIPSSLWTPANIGTARRQITSLLGITYLRRPPLASLFFAPSQINSLSAQRIRVARGVRISRYD